MEEVTSLLGLVPNVRSLADGEGYERSRQGLLWEDTSEGWGALQGH